MDRTTKILLAAIAAGLWVNAIGTVLRPARADDTGVWLGRIANELTYLTDIADDVHALANGGLKCTNSKICGL
jgi:hypothetical protein